MNNELFFECECGGEAISFEVDADDPAVYVSLWQRGYHHHPRSLWDRLRTCWRVLRKGRDVSDQIVLSRADAERLSQRLSWWLSPEHTGIDAVTATKNLPRVIGGTEVEIDS